MILATKLLAKTVCVFTLLCLSSRRVTSITWGDEDTENAYPAVGATFYNRTKREEANGFEFFPDGSYDYDRFGLGCTVYLIAPKIALTAAHCFADRIKENYFTENGQPVLTEDGLEEYWVSFNSPVLVPECNTIDQLPNRYDCRNTTDVNALGLSVEKIVMHPDFVDKSAFYEHDYAAVILKENVTDIDVVSVIDEVDYLKNANLNSQGDLFTSVGYGGFFSDESDKKWDIQYDDIRRFASGHYRSLTKRWIMINMNNKVDGDGGTCYGDSGGPIFYQDDTTSEQVVVAQTHWGDVKCIAMNTAERLDLKVFQDWLDDLLLDYGSP